MMSMRLARPGLVATVVVLAVSTIFAQEVGYLDLTDPAPRQPIHSTTGGGVGGYCAGGSSGSSVFPEVTLTLVSVDKSTYSMGEEVTFEVKVENTGKQNIELPWTPHLGDLEPSDRTLAYTYRSAVVILTLTDPDSHRSMELFGNSYGSMDVPGSIRELRASQSVFIRARRRLETYDDWWRKRIQEVQPLIVRASPGFMVNEMTYSPSEKDLLGSLNTRCAPMNTKKANQLDIFLWPRSPK